MRIIKKFLLLFLACAMIVPCMVPSVLAAADNDLGYTYSASLASASIGSKQTAQQVVMHVAANKPFPVDAIGMTVIIPAGWTVASIQNSDLVFPAANIDLNNGKVNYATPDAENRTTVHIATVTYNVPAGVAPGTYELGITGLTISKDYGTEWERNGSASTLLTVTGKTLGHVVRFYANGGVGTAADAPVASGSVYVLPACMFIPPAGKQFRAWNVDGVEKQPGDALTVRANVAVFAVWQDVPGVAPGTKNYTVTATAGEGGSISPAGVTSVKEYDDIIYVITTQPGYEIDAVLVDGVNMGRVSRYTFGLVVANHTIEVTFRKNAPLPEGQIYTDVAADAWYYDDVVFVTDRGLMNGVGDSQFAPNTVTDRAMIVTVLWRMEGSPKEKAASDFRDVASGMWYTEAVRWAAAHGIVNGYGDGRFGPTDKITREQVMAILHRYAVYKKETDGAILPMLDTYTYSPWAEKDVFWAENNGLLDNIGIKVNNLTAQASRGEIASYLHRFCLFMEES